MTTQQDRDGASLATRARGVPEWAWVALALVALLAAVGSRYGFHRDELYFVEAGRHPALAYADQPALVPLLATAWHDLVGGALWAFRLVPALAAGGVVAVSALTARELGADARATTWTAVVVATATTLAVTGHLFGTTVFDVLTTSALVLGLLRAVRRGSAGSWLLVGVLAAVALLVKTLPATVLLCAVIALLAVGPREVFRSPRAWLAAALAAVGLAPTLVWQQAEGWPQAALAASIATGGSGTSVDRALLLPMLATLTGPLTAGVLVVGAVVLWRTPGRRWAALVPALLVLVVLATGGKPYYLMGVVPLLVAAGVPACLRWAARGHEARRTGLLTGLVAVNAVVGAVLALPLLPPSLAPVDVVYDHGEQVGWPELAAAVEDASLDTGAELVLTRNYGEAGALDSARDRGAELPPVVSGHNAYWWWGPPEGEPQAVLVVGRWSEQELGRWFVSCVVVDELGNDAGVDNDEAGAPLRLCDGAQRPWAEMWPEVRRLG
ncbi:glycosyltransferase family 39 protein [Aquipuribacter hungaricus]|uniref:Glycosyltransferase family 39 protein n=1 Tax=Aquipuribacter hungaricus TaxID=545624 RepID=A0ABV7WEY6_9MICO